MSASRQITELDSVVADFVEQEIGKFDWANNWKKLKSESDPVERVETWLKSYGLEVDAVEVVRRLDDMTVTGGAWR